MQENLEEKLFIGPKHLPVEKEILINILYKN